MEEKELKYMGKTVHYKDAVIADKKDNYGRSLTFKIGKRSDAELVTNTDTGIMYWTAGAFFDMHINKYVEDEEYENLTEEQIVEIYEKNNG